MRVRGRAGREVGKLRRHRLAHHDRTGSASQRNRGRVARGTSPAVDRRAVARGPFGGVEDVLHADRHAGQTAGCSARRQRRVERTRVGQRVVGVERLPRMQRRLARGDAVERGPHRRLGSQVAARHCTPRRDRRGRHVAVGRDTRNEIDARHERSFTSCILRNATAARVSPGLQAAAGLVA
jgi:hypothetical protein